MIQYALTCENRHSFDAWFRNADAYDEQAARGIVTCPICSTQNVEKSLMAPAIAKSGQKAGPDGNKPVAQGNDKMSFSAGHPQQAQLRAAMRALREKVVAEADYVGDKFAEEARRIHDHEADPRGIYGEATRDEVAGLIEDGIDCMPLPNVPEDHN